MPLTLDKLRKRYDLIRRATWRMIIPLDDTWHLPQSPSPVSRPSELRDEPWMPIQCGDLWGERWQTVWLRQHVAIPSELSGNKLALHLRWREDATQWSEDTIETQVFLGNRLLAGLDAEHRLAILPALDEPIEVFLQSHVGQRQSFGGIELVVLDESTEQLAYTLHVGLDTVEQLDPNGLARSRMLDRLNRAYNMLDLQEGTGSERFYESVRQAHHYLDEQLLEGLDGGARPQIVATGHAHLDVAWLWPLWRTRQKTAHTFATMLHLMEQYPEFHFTASTPQLYAFVKQDYPELYKQIKQRIREGRWEPIGAMWLEADCNIPSGESLVRQFLFGLRFSAEEFGIRDRVLWMPDVFGYSGALPQIMRSCGIDTFTTTKISWSQFNRMPFDTFRWRGIDGSEVLTHFVTTPDPKFPFYTYNGHMTPAEVAGAWREYRQKAINDELLYLVGWGDGGGGTTVEQLESARRLADMPDMPQVRFGSANDYFQRLHERVDNHPSLPTWVGELYLEYHRGTYTSQGQVKQANRRAEQLFHDAEFLDAWASLEQGYSSQREMINQGWQLILLNQFHDILPGSSIAEVYQDAAAHYAEIMRIGKSVRDRALEQIIKGSNATLLAINTLSWERTDPVFMLSEVAANLEIPSPSQPVENMDGTKGTLLVGECIPAYGMVNLMQTRDYVDNLPLQITTEYLENQFFRIELDQQGEITSLYDKRYDRDVLIPGSRGNQLVAFEDRPLEFNAWDIDIYFEEKQYPVDDLQRIKIIETGPIRGGVEISRRFLSSTIRQRILIYTTLPRIDFATEIDWHEHQILLKAAFPINVNTTRATYEIQFGAVERPTHRNTSWDMARFETCAQRWVDLSESDYGVALLNDSKYGHDVKYNLLRLTLLKSGVYPDPNADQGLHRFVYSLLPHAGDWRSGEVVRRAAELNAPLLTYAPQSSSQEQNEPHLSRSLVACDATHVVLDTIKTAEDGDSLIVRLYETHNQRGSVTLTFPQPIESAYRCNLLEEASGDVEVAGNLIRFQIKPFEIVTLRVELGGFSAI
jgi:alpha-mannosidase